MRYIVEVDEVFHKTNLCSDVYVIYAIISRDVAEKLEQIYREDYDVDKVLELLKQVREVPHRKEVIHHEDVSSPGSFISVTTYRITANEPFAVIVLHEYDCDETFKALEFYYSKPVSE